MLLDKVVDLNGYSDIIDYLNPIRLYSMIQKSFRQGLWTKVDYWCRHEVLLLRTSIGTAGT